MANGLFQSKKPYKEAWIMETLGDFLKRFSTDVACYCKKNKSNYSLKKYDSDRRGHMGVFGWVRERSTKDLFVISTYECLADTRAIAEADRKKAGAHYISKDRDPEGKGTGLYYYVRRGSKDSDYQKAVRALRAVCKNR